MIGGLVIVSFLYLVNDPTIEKDSAPRFVLVFGERPTFEKDSVESVVSFLYVLDEPTFEKDSMGNIASFLYLVNDPTLEEDSMETTFRSCTW